jgi:hypothetical protein
VGVIIRVNNGVDFSHQFGRCSREFCEDGLCLPDKDARVPDIVTVSADSFARVQSWFSQQNEALKEAMSVAFVNFVGEANIAIASSGWLVLIPMVGGEALAAMSLARAGVFE